MAYRVKNVVLLIWNIAQGTIVALLIVAAGFFTAGKIGLIAPYAAYIILSGSMEPVLPVGSVAFTQKQPFYHAGDVIAFKRGGEKIAVTHRVAGVATSDVYFGDETYTTKGDANKTPDADPVLQSNVTGKVFLTVPYLGYIVDFAKSPKGFLALIIIPATIIIYEELKNVRKELAKTFRSFMSRFRKQRPENSDMSGPELSAHKESRFPPKAAIIPVMAALFIFAGTAGAYFYDKEHSTHNVLGASESFGEKTASLYESDPFTCPGGATNMVGPTFGTVVLKLTDSNVLADIILSGAIPNAAYDIWLNQYPGGCPLPSPTQAGAITTDGSGNGLAHVEAPRVLTAANYWISAVGGGQLLRSIAVVLP